MGIYGKEDRRCSSCPGAVGKLLEGILHNFSIKTICFISQVQKPFSFSKKIDVFLNFKTIEMLFGVAAGCGTQNFRAKYELIKDGGGELLLNLLDEPALSSLFCFCSFGD